MANKTKEQRQQQRATLLQVWRYIRRCRWLLLLSILLAAITVAITLYIPILLGRVIDLIVGAGQVDFGGMSALLTRCAVLILITALLQWVMNTVNNAMTYQVIRDMRRDAFHHIQQLPLSYLDAHPVGDIVSRIITDVDQFADGLLMGFTQLFTGVVTILGTLLFMLAIHPAITLAVVVLTPLSLLIASFIARRTFTMFREQSITRGQQTALIDEMVNEQKTVQAFGYEEESQRRFDEVNERLQKCSLRATFFSSLVNPTTRFVNNVIYAVVGLLGAFAAISGGLTVGALSCFLNYAGQYAKPFNEISGVVTELQNALACAGRFFELIGQPTLSPEPAATLPQPVTGRVEMQKVAFAYTPDKPLIQDLNLRVQPGQKVAIVGPTGCGKTTLINLLMRFYDVVEGEITVEGVDIRSISRHSLREAFGMVLQDTWLREGTIRENLLFGNSEATEEDVVAAAKAAHAHNFIRRLPQGYDTIITEDSGNLSAGQRQLLCIARVMLSKPAILILDEATSSIDARTEQRIQSAFDRLTEGRTAFIVAHRLSTIRTADVILVMKDGHIIEQGRHEELLEKGGFYAQLYQTQFAH